jgi:aminoglycoside N3'-acetyltransferase
MKLSDILNKLEIEPKRSVVYLHIGADNLKPIADIATIFKDIFNYYDNKSTICMPSFPFTGSGYFDYLLLNPLFDVNKTPCRVNFASEIFRRREGVMRSIHPYLSVACYGHLADELTAEHHHDVKVFGPKSPFGKILECNGYVVGLGVDCNTNSFAHMPDDRMLDLYNFKVYEDYNLTLPCIDYLGKKINVETNVVRKIISKAIKPRVMERFYRNYDFYKGFCYKGIPFYSLNVFNFVKANILINKCYVKYHGYPIYYDVTKL